MSGESSTSAGAVFLSYASQDAEAAQRICDALRAGGIEVWLDKSELRGGDAWDRSIRQQIHYCALFVPIISQHTHERLEGYFRLEWKLAVDRTHTMAEVKAFLVPVVIDGTTEQDLTIPEKFRELQWTRLPAGETPPAFVERVKRLLAGDTTIQSRRHATPSTAPAGWRIKRLLPIAASMATLGVAVYLSIEKPWVSKPVVASAAKFTPPLHSVAVLPFVNMSGDKEQEYFSDGLTEELLNSLAKVSELQVAARTSAFSFKGKDTDIGLIARKLNVGAILEGSVRRSGNTIRISTELINAVTGFQLWSQSYDRDLGDVLKLQTEIATAVAGALKVTLLDDIAQKIELGGTRNAAAFDDYLRGLNLSSHGYLHSDSHELEQAIADFDEAIQLDPQYALAYAQRAIARTTLAATTERPPEVIANARADAERAIALAPDLADAHLALAQTLWWGTLEYGPASKEYQRAVALAPGYARALDLYSSSQALTGHADEAVAAIRKAIRLDPLNASLQLTLSRVLYSGRRYDEALAAANNYLNLDASSTVGHGVRGYIYTALGRYRDAVASCSGQHGYLNQVCLAVAYNKLGRRPEAQSALTEMQSELGDYPAYQYAQVYAQWGEKAQALRWLETALRTRDSGLAVTKVDSMLDPLRQEPRFQAVMRELKFPD